MSRFKKIGSKKNPIDEWDVERASEVLSEAEDIKGNSKLMKKVKSKLKEDIEVTSSLLQNFGMDKEEVDSGLFSNS